MLSVLLAANELPDPKSAEAIGWLFVTVGGACLALNQIASLYFTLKPRKTPPDHEIYATKIELALAASKLEAAAELAKKEHKESDARIEGRFETWMDQQKDQHDESMNKLESAMNKFSDWQKTIENALGRIGTKADIALEAKMKK